MSVQLINKAQELLNNIPLNVISQGAEAIVFETQTHPFLPKSNQLSTTKFIIKYRPRKPYRHPTLDLQIVNSRTQSEARLLHKLYQLGIKAPRLIAVDGPNGIIWMESVGGTLPNGETSSLKNMLWFKEKSQEERKDSENESNIALDGEVRDIMSKVGAAVAKLHLANIVHGDLTSSNIILDQRNDKWEPMLIDFGLSSYSLLAEDEAVDLYVLERALISTHPIYSKSYNEWLLQGYERTFKEASSSKKFREISRRLQDVRLRGRKRSMLG